MTSCNWVGLHSATKQPCSACSIGTGEYLYFDSLGIYPVIKDLPVSEVRGVPSSLLV